MRMAYRRVQRTFCLGQLRSYGCSIELVRLPRSKPAIVLAPAAVVSLPTQL
jgi:hypothetical protein